MEDNLKEKNDISQDKSTMNESAEANRVSSSNNSSRNNDDNHDGNKDYDEQGIDENISFFANIKSMIWSVFSPERAAWSVNSQHSA